MQRDSGERGDRCRSMRNFARPSKRAWPITLNVALQNRVGAKTISGTQIS
jgi:hypothetical protein